MEKVMVYVVGFESSINGVSFWDWYPQEKNAINRERQLNSNTALINNGIVYKGSLLVNNSEDEEDITIQVENFLGENDWENAFKKTIKY
jgi:hypothetical protein